MPALAVVDREQHLCGGDPESAEHLLIRVREQDLSRRGRRLLVLEPRAAPVELQLARAERDGARRHDHDFLALRAQLGDVGAHAFEPCAIERAGR